MGQEWKEEKRDRQTDTRGQQQQDPGMGVLMGIDRHRRHTDDSDMKSRAECELASLLRKVCHETALLGRDF